MKLSKDGDSSSFSVSVGLPRKSRIGNQEVIMMEWNSENDLINKHGMCSKKSEFQYLLCSLETMRPYKLMFATHD